MRRDGRLQEVDPWKVVIDDSEEVFEMYSWMWDEESVVCEQLGLAEPKVEDVRERSLTKPNVMSVTCPACGMSNSVAWGSMDLPPFRQAVAMLADSWNSR